MLGDAATGEYARHGAEVRSWVARGHLLDRGFLTGVGSPDAVVEYARHVAVVDLEGGEIARTASALVRSDGLSEPSDLGAPEGGGGRSPTWLSVGFDDEEALHATGLVPGRSPAEAWRLEAWTDTGRWRPLPATPTVYAAPGTVPVADATMNGVVVAGRLAAERPTPGTRPPLALWSGPNFYARAKRWARLPLRNERESDWRRLAAPEGEIEAARSSRGDIYLLVDGKLWHGQLDELPPAR